DGQEQVCQIPAPDTISGVGAYRDGRSVRVNFERRGSGGTQSFDVTLFEFCTTSQEGLGTGRAAVSPDVACGTGFRAEGGRWVALSCPPGQRLAGTTCEAIVCPPGQVLQGSACVTLQARRPAEQPFITYGNRDTEGGDLRTLKNIDVQS